MRLTKRSTELATEIARVSSFAIRVSFEIRCCLLGDSRLPADLGRARRHQLELKLAGDFGFAGEGSSGSTEPPQADRPPQSTIKQIHGLTRNVGCCQDDTIMASGVYCCAGSASISQENTDSVGRCNCHCCLVIILESSMGRVPSHAAVLLRHINILHKGISPQIDVYVIFQLLFRIVIPSLALTAVDCLLF
jgi:hypothetical protein